MAHISSLHLYPVKSCAGLSVPSAKLGRAGLEIAGVADREWMVVDATTGEFVTQRQTPRLALVRPSVEDDHLVLGAPGVGGVALPLDDVLLRSPTLPVKVWNHACLAYDEGDMLATWFSGFLGRAVRLARFDASHRRASSREWTGSTEALNRFSDGFPMLVISEASLADLNARLARAGRDALPMNRFRPNIVLGGMEAFDEDRLLSLRDGPVVLQPVKPCPRCQIPSIDQETGEPGPDPLDILALYREQSRLGIVFGQNTMVKSGAGSTLTVGQTLQEEWNF